MFGVWESINELTQGCVDLPVLFIQFFFGKSSSVFTGSTNCEIATQKKRIRGSRSLDRLGTVLRYQCVFCFLFVNFFFLSFVHRQLVIFGHLCKVQSFSRTENSTRKQSRATCVHCMRQLSTAEPRQCDLCLGSRSRLKNVTHVSYFHTLVSVCLHRFHLSLRADDTTRTKVEENEEKRFIFKAS